MQNVIPQKQVSHALDTVKTEGYALCDTLTPNDE